MNKEYILKESPLLKLVLHKDKFEIINTQYENESGVFKYSKLYDIEFRESSPDLMSTGFFRILSIFLPGPTSGSMNFGDRIRMNYDGKERKVLLFDFDKNKTIEAVEKIRSQINPKFFFKT